MAEVFRERLEVERPVPLVLLTIGWKRAARGPRNATDGVPQGVAGQPARRPGNMILISEGEGEGAREETALDTREALTSQC